MLIIGFGGFGGIGQAVAQALKALGMRVTVMARSTVRHKLVDHVVRPEGLGAAAANADAVIQTLPGTESTHHLLDASFFASLKQSATSVSVGRGNVVDERALADSLSSGRVGFAALDVFEQGPLPGESHCGASRMC